MGKLYKLYSWLLFWCFTDWTPETLLSHPSGWHSAVLILMPYSCGMLCLHVCVCMEGLVSLQWWPSRINGDFQKNSCGVPAVLRSLCWGWLVHPGSWRHSSSLHPRASCARNCPLEIRNTFGSWSAEGYRNIKIKIKKLIEGQLLKRVLNWFNSTDFNEVTELYTSLVS